MSIYARIWEGRVVELFETELDIADLFPSEMTWVNVDGINGIEFGWSAIFDGENWSFNPYVPPPPTSEETLLANSVKLGQATQLAAQQKTALTNRASTLQDAIDLEMATPAEVAELPLRQAQLIEWKRYAIYLGRVTTQAGWHMTVDWPVQPAQGMDLTVSAARSAQTSS